MKAIKRLVQSARAKLQRRQRLARRPVYRSTGMETLESRTLMSASMWTIRGGSGADTILITPDATDPGTLHCTINGVDAGSRSASALRGIRITAGSGDDTVNVDTGDDSNLRCTITGGNGDDLLVGGTENDNITGGNGNDQIDGGDGTNCLNGGNGNDTVTGGAGTDTILGGRGADTLRGNGGPDRLDAGHDRFHNFIYASAGARLLHTTSADTVVGGDQTNALRQADSATDLNQWLIDAAVQHWQGLFGQQQPCWNGWFERLPMASNVPGDLVTALSSAAGNAGSPSGSATNNQIAGVDEADLVKTDGNFVYLLSGSNLLIIDTSNPDSPQIVSTTPVDGYASQLYISGDTVTVLSSINGGFNDWPIPVNLHPIPEATSTPIGGLNGLLGSLGDVIGNIGDLLGNLGGDLHDTIQHALDGSLTGDDLHQLANDVHLPQFDTADVTDFADTLTSSLMMRPIWWHWNPQVEVTTFNVADRAHPAIAEQSKLDGSLTSSRMIDGRLFVVVGNNIAWPEPLIALNPDGVPTYESADAYRARLQALDLGTLLPNFTTDLGGDGTIDRSGSLVDGVADFIPVNTDAQSVVSVVMFDPAADPIGPDSTSSIIGSTGTVFASATSLYIAAADWVSPALGSDWGHAATDIYKFDLTASGAAFAAAGSVTGNVRDSFAMDEAADGSFRIATTDWSQGSQSSTLTILQQDGQAFDTVGQLTDIAPGESIQAVRYVGDTAYIVTFRQVDPLFVIDLSNPAAPTITGQLTVPGFSSYLQSLDATHLIGFGRAPGSDPDVHWLTSLELSLFDVTDPANPTRTDSLPLGDGNYNFSEAEWDHHAFSYFADQGVVAVPVASGNWDSIATGVAVVAVDPATGFTSLGQVTTDATARRTLLIGSDLYVITDTQVVVAALLDPTNILATLDLPESSFHWPPFAIL